MSAGTRRALRAACILLALGVAGPAPADEPVRITATDGVQLGGHLYGTTGPGVVLGHMYPADQTSWTAFARTLAAEGFRALTFDFRGYGTSEGVKNVALIDRDVEGAYRYLVGRKIRPVFLVGASMGGTASLIVASRVPVAGVAALSSPVSFRGLDAEPRVPAVTAPTLLLAAEGDHRAVAAARRLEALARAPTRVLVVPGRAHGTAVLATPAAAEVRRALLGFLGQPGG